jgi:long-chain fatty acid transport protein
MSFNKSKLALAVATAAGLTFSSGAFATNGIMQAGNGMAAHGLGGAGISNANEAMSGYDNPALISQTGDSMSIGFSVFMPDRTTTIGGTDYTSDAKMYGIPQVAFTSKIDDNMSWGVMVNAMGGMSTSYREVPGASPSAAFPQSVDWNGVMIAPTMSFALNKNFTLGASLLMAYNNFRINNLYGLEGAGMDSLVTNEGSFLAYGAKLGLDAKVTDGISVGVTLQPKLVAEELGFWKDFMTAMGFSGDAALVTPNTVGVGAKFAIGKNVDVVADILYYQWTSVDVFDFFGWEDQMVYKVGAEFRTSDKLALRAGFNYGKSPIQDDVALQNYPFPAVSEIHLTVGMGYKMDKNMTVNAYYLYSPESTIDDASGMGSISMTQNAFGIGINYAAK